MMKFIVKKYEHSGYLVLEMDREHIVDVVDEYYTLEEAEGVAFTLQFRYDTDDAYLMPCNNEELPF